MFVCLCVCALVCLCACVLAGGWFVFVVFMRGRVLVSFCVCVLV